MKVSILVGVLAAVPALHAQKAAQPDPVPSLQVEFSTNGGTPVSFPSPVVTQLPVCYSGDSCIANVALDRKNFAQIVGVSFDLSGKSHLVDPAAIQNLSYVQILSSTPTPGGAAVLVHGDESNDGIGVRLVPKSGAQPSDRSGLSEGYYVCFFNREGEPTEVHSIDPRYIPAKIAYLDSDQILLLLVDKISEKPVLALMATDGQIVRTLDDQGALTIGGDLVNGSGMKIPNSSRLANPIAANQIMMGAALAGWQIGYAGKRLLLLQPGAKAIVWSILPGGGIRRVKLKMPPGVVASTIVSSDHAWLIRSFIAASDTGLLLEFDPDTGDALRRIDTKGTPPTSVLFASNGDYYAIWWGKSNHSSILKSE